MELPITNSTSELETLFLSKAFLTISRGMCDLLNEISEVYQNYETLLNSQKINGGLYFKRDQMALNTQVAFIRQRIKQCAGLGPPDPDGFSEYVAWTQLQYYMQWGTELVDTIETNVSLLIPPSPKSLPEGVLTIEQVLDILDGKHPSYVLLKNKIRDVQPRSMCHEYLQRLHFKLKCDDEGQRFYVDYITNSLMNNDEGREYLSEQIVDGDYEDVMYTIKRKKTP